MSETNTIRLSDYSLVGKDTALAIENGLHPLTQTVIAGKCKEVSTVVAQLEVRLKTLPPYQTALEMSPAVWLPSYKNP
jgi:hypothetical protein